jgi:hypothetical protein
VGVSERLLAMTGYVYIDGDSVGSHEIQYGDLVGEDVPIQQARRVVNDDVYLDEDNVGFLNVEWNDNVADFSEGSTTYRVKEVVRLLG